MKQTKLSWFANLPILDAFFVAWHFSTINAIFGINSRSFVIIGSEDPKIYFSKIIRSLFIGSYEKKMKEKKVIRKFWEKFFQKRSDLLQKVADWNLGGHYFSGFFLKKCLKNFHTNSKTQPKLPYRFPWFFLLFKQPPLTHQFAKFQASGFFRSRVRWRIKS